MKVKTCWLSRQTKEGWRLALCVGDKKQYNLEGLILKSEDDVKKVLDAGLVFIHLSDIAMAKAKKSKNGGKKMGC